LHTLPTRLHVFHAPDDSIEHAAGGDLGQDQSRHDISATRSRVKNGDDLIDYLLRLHWVASSNTRDMSVPPNCRPRSRQERATAAPSPAHSS